MYQCGTACFASLASQFSIAAEFRTGKKHSRYAQLCRIVGSKLIAVVEGYGVSCDCLVGLSRLLTGLGDRDPSDDSDCLFAQCSRVSYIAQHVAFSTVIAGAAMVTRLVNADLSGTDLSVPDRTPPPARVVFVTDAVMSHSHARFPSGRRSSTTACSPLRGPAVSILSPALPAGASSLPPARSRSASIVSTTSCATDVTANYRDVALARPASPCDLHQAEQVATVFVPHEEWHEYPFVHVSEALTPQQ